MVRSASTGVGVGVFENGSFVRSLAEFQFPFSLLVSIQLGSSVVPLVKSVRNLGATVDS